MYGKILVPMALDHGISAQTLRIARTLRSEGGTIVALHVHEAPQASVRAYLDDEAVRQGQDLARATMEAKLGDAADVTGDIRTGHTARTIIDYAGAQGIDCIVIGSHRPGFGDYFLGSTASRVVRHAPCAVHVHRSS